MNKKHLIILPVRAFLVILATTAAVFFGAHSAFAFTINQPRALFMLAQGQQGYNQQGIAVDAVRQRAFVTDMSGSRVTVWDLSRLTQNQQAVNVLGQPDFTTSTAATTATGFNQPAGIAYDAGHSRLFVADELNNRVLVFDVSGTITNQMPAVNVLGQTNFTTAACSLGNQGCLQPVDVAYDPNHDRLFVADRNQDRVLVFDVAAITDGELAINVIGDTDFTPTQCASLTATCFDYPLGLAYDPNHDRLFVAVGGQHRVMIFDTATITDGEAAVNVFGAPDLTSAAFVGPCQRCTGQPIRITYDATNDRIFVDSNHGYLITTIFDVAPSTIVDGAPAIGIFGADDYTTTNPCSFNICGPRGGYYDSTNRRYYGVQFYCCDINVYSEVPPAPASVSRPSVPAIVPGELTLRGNYFYDGATVTVGGVAANVVFVSQTELTVTLPTGLATGAKDIVVTNLDAQTGTCGGCVTYDAGGGYIRAPTFSGNGYGVTDSAMGGTVVFDLGDGSYGILRVPADATNGKIINLSIGQFDSAGLPNLSPLPAGATIVGPLFRFTAALDDGTEANLTKKATIVMEIVDRSMQLMQFDQASLAIYRYDKTLSEWKKLDTVMTVYSTNLISAGTQTDHFGVFALMSVDALSASPPSSDAASALEPNPEPPLRTGTQSSPHATASLSGTITIDRLGGSPLAEATVTLQPANLTVRTNAAGRYQFNTVEAGNYTLAISRPGYRSYTSRAIMVKARDVLNRNFYLPILPPVARQSATPLRRDISSERQAIGLFGRLYGRLPAAESDWRLVRYLAYGGVLTKRDLNKERQAIGRFNVIFRHSPSSAQDWRVVHLLGYGASMELAR